MWVIHHLYQQEPLWCVWIVSQNQKQHFKSYLLEESMNQHLVVDDHLTIHVLYYCIKAVVGWVIWPNLIWMGF